MGAGTTTDHFIQDAAEAYIVFQHLAENITDFQVFVQPENSLV